MKVLQEAHLLRNWTWKRMVASAHLDMDYIMGECVEKHSLADKTQSTLIVRDAIEIQIDWLV